MQGGRVVFWCSFTLLCVCVGMLAGCTGTGTQKQGEGNTTQEPDRLRASWSEVARLPIFDRTGMILAMSEKSLSVFVTSARPGPWTTEVCGILGLDPDDVSRRLSGVNGMVCLSRSATPSQVQSLERCGLDGLKICQGYQRRYPYGSTASPVLGLVDPRGMGVAGVESVYDSFLTSSTRASGAKPGAEGLVLCMEKDLQIAAEKELARQMHRLRAGKGCLVLMDTSNGEILAMASLPGWDPERYWEYDPAGLRNAAITDSWDPVLLFPVLAKILENPGGPGENPQESPVEAGTVWKSPGLKWDWTDLSDRLSIWSPWAQREAFLNVNLEKALGKLYSLGLGRPTGIDLPGEEIGGLPTTFPETWTEIEGLRASPLQMLRAFSTLVNTGHMVVPHIAMTPPARDHAPTVRQEDLKWINPDHVLCLRKELSFRMRPYLVSVRQMDDGNGKESFQVVLLGFWPGKHPGIAYVLGLDQAARNPRKTRGTFMHILRLADRARSLALFANGKTRQNKTGLQGRGNRMPDLRGLSMRQAYQILRDLDIEVRIRGTGMVTSQLPAAGVSLKNIKVCTIICKGMES